MNSLRLFFNNENEREAVKAFLIETLGEIAKKRAFAGEDVKGIPDARELIETTFDKLQELYGIIEKPIIHNSK